MASTLNHAQYMHSRKMTAHIEESDLALFPAEQQFFSPDMYANNMQTFIDPNMGAYDYARHDSFHPAPEFDPALFGDASQPFIKQSPTLYSTDSDLRLPPSNISTASGASAASSTMGSPYSGHAMVAPAIPEWTTQGLGIAPTIAGDHYPFAQEYSFGFSGMDNDFAYPEINKPHGYVGECENISALDPRASLSSSSSISTFIPSSSSLDTTMNSIFARNDSHGNDSDLTMSPLSVMSPILSGKDNHVFKSPITPASSSPLSTRRFSTQSFGSSFLGTASTGSWESRQSPNVPQTQSFKSNMADGLSNFSHSPYPSSSFFSQSSGHFVPPLESLCLFPLSL